jgi:hypothetical protein
MQILSPDKNATVRTPDSENTYVRTGVYGDGSCFLHAYLRIVKGAYYKSSSYEERFKMVQDLRRDLAARVNEGSLKAVGGGELRRLLFFNKIKEHIELGFPNDSARGKMLNTMVDLNAILEKSMTPGGNFYQLFVGAIKERCIEHMTSLSSAEQAGIMYAYKFEKYVLKWCYDVFYECHGLILEEFKKNLLTEQIGHTEIEFISRAVGVNFLFMQEKEDELVPYTGVTAIQEDAPVFVFVWVGEAHYEILGRMCEDKSILRRFTLDDPFVVELLKIEEEG